jgi:hypothetical protein
VNSLLQSLGGRTIDAIEIYSGISRLPSEFGGGDARCGAIVVWTRQNGGR